MLAEKFIAQFSSCELIWCPTEILQKIVQGPNEFLHKYISHFTRVALTVTDFNDQTRRSTFVPNIHPTKQYKYLLGHQDTQSFITLMEIVASHALTEEKINLFTEPAMPIIHAPLPLRTNS